MELSVFEYVPCLHTVDRTAGKQHSFRWVPGSFSIANRIVGNGGLNLNAVIPQIVPERMKHTLCFAEVCNEHVVAGNIRVVDRLGGSAFGSAVMLWELVRTAAPQNRTARSMMVRRFIRHLFRMCGSFCGSSCQRRNRPFAVPAKERFRRPLRAPMRGWSAHPRIDDRFSRSKGPRRKGGIHSAARF